MGWFGKKQQEKVTLEKQLEDLINIGIKLNSGITIDHLLISFSREKYEMEPYELLLGVMGGETEDDNPKRISDDIWHLDTECIYDNGDYITIASNMKALARGFLPIADIKDHVDTDSGIAWLSFKLDGIQYKWDFQVNEDWIDSKVFVEFEKLLSKKTNSIKYIHIDSGGQDCLIACMSDDQVKILKKMISSKITLHL